MEVAQSRLDKYLVKHSDQVLEVLEKGAKMSGLPGCLNKFFQDFSASVL